ncbi:cytochrome P450 [Epithele typhae]|uniref:cytochrome P450 n=1 Tax=Epithele typhae TaxID=378194 RepID=UPI002008CB9C|nr:cytochrome P450 [Epithele typhae]KAH9941843.1 cytochrome P450 [Epithele typhae]
MDVSLTQAVLAGGASLVLWTLVRRLTAPKSDLDNIPGPPSPSFLIGNTAQVRSRVGWDFHRELAEKYGTVAQLKGLFGKKTLYVHDPKAIYHIAVKDLDIWEEANYFTRTTYRNFGPGLFSTHGEHHRKQRKILNPAFSVTHLREMLPIFYDVLRQAIEMRMEDGEAEVNMVGWMGRTALELVGQAGLGYSFDPLIEDSTDPFAEALKGLMPCLSELIPWPLFFPLAEKLVPESWLRPIADMLPWPALHRLCHYTDVMHEKSLEIIANKRRAIGAGDDALKREVGEGKDIISLLLKANMASAEEDRLPDAELVAQVSVLSFAAMDTTSNALSRTLWCLALHPDWQDKVRAELLQAKAQAGGADLDFDTLTALPLLDAVCRETLRLYVPAPFRFREAREATVLPLHTPVRGRDGRTMYELVVPKDTPAFVSIEAANTSPALWGPDAHAWRPARWLAPLPASVADAKIPGLYSNLMTFWAGGRGCIGFKFSQVEMKVVLAVLLSTFVFELSDTPVHWNLAAIVYPSTELGGVKPEMPMKVRLLKH